MVHVASNLFNFAAHVSWTEEGQWDGICEVSFYCLSIKRAAGAAEEPHCLHWPLGLCLGLPINFPTIAAHGEFSAQSPPTANCSSERCFITSSSNTIITITALFYIQKRDIQYYFKNTLEDFKTSFKQIVFFLLKITSYLLYFVIIYPTNSWNRDQDILVEY